MVRGGGNVPGVSKGGKTGRYKNGSSKGNSLVDSQRILWPSRSAVDFSLRASASAQTEAVVADKVSETERTTTINGVKLYVGLPLDTVSSSGTINHVRAMAAGLKALKLLGIDGVELPVWWGIAERKAMGEYDWTGYLDIVKMVQELDLKLHVSLCFHASEEPMIPLPQWVAQIGESDKSIYFTDRSGQQYKNCLSLGVDNLPVLDGKTPLEVYRMFCVNFKSAFSPFMGSTITDLSIGLGPDGELRYPSHHHPTKSRCHSGPGEFQCYDKNMLHYLKHHADSQGNPLYGLGGPHDAPSYDQPPISGGFFAEHGGSWESPYGDFFLSWYSGNLARHGDQMLSLAASIFEDAPITLSGKIPLMHSWCNARSHPSELTAGFYNTVHRNGYEAIAEIFSRNSCNVILPGMDLSNDDLPTEFHSSPESLLAQITSSCRKLGAGVTGQNLSDSSSLSGGFKQIIKKLSGENAAVDMFMYQRMGAYFFSPEHFPGFTQFIGGLNQPSQSLDDLALEGEEDAELVPRVGMQQQQMQIA